MAESRYNKSKFDSEEHTRVTIRMIQSSRESDKAQLFYLEDTEHWLPRSQIIILSGDVKDKPHIKLVDMPLWLARRQNIQDHIE